jgi:hypothetical protein
VILGFVAGLMVGGTLGFVCAAIMAVASEPETPRVPTDNRPANVRDIKDLPPTG